MQGEVRGLEALLKSMYGVKSSYRINPVTGAVGVAVTQILHFNPNRVGLLIMNTGSTTLYLSPTNALTSTTGIILAGPGGGITFKWDTDMELVSQEFYALSSAAGGSIFALETYLIG